MAQKTITVNGIKYLIRGNWTVEQLESMYDSFLIKYPGTKTTYLEWLNRGHIYCKVRDRKC